MRHPGPARQQGWSATIIALHWGTVASVVILLGSGWLLAAQATPLGQRAVTLELHASLGLLLLAATMARIVVRVIVKRPSNSIDSRLLDGGARLVHAALYLTLLGLIVTGVLLAQPRPFMRAVEVFGLWPLPRISGVPPAFMRNMPAIHSALVWVLIGLVGLHVAAAIFGTLIRGERTLSRMLPRSGRRPKA